MTVWHLYPIGVRDKKKFGSWKHLHICWLWCAIFGYILIYYETLLCFRCWYPKLCFSFVNHIVFIYYRTIKDLYIALLLITLYFPLCWSVTLFFIYYRRLVSSFEKVNLHAVSPFQSCFCSKSIDVVLIELRIAAIRWLIANHVICKIQVAKIMYSSIPSVQIFLFRP